MEIALDTLRAVVTDTPLASTPRLALDIPQLIVGEFADRAGFERLLPSTFGSREWLGSETDDLLFDDTSRELVAAGLYLPPASAPAEAGIGLPAEPRVVRGGLRAQEKRDVTLAQTTVLHCDPEARELVCLRDPEVVGVGAPLDARIGIAPGLALLVRAGEVVGWSLTDPSRYLTTGYADADTAPPAPATGLRLAECLALITRPLIDEVMDQEPSAWHRLRTTERALREQGDRGEDPVRAAALHQLVARLIEDYENW
ncbi:hypothetical protein [Streptomyces sp. Cmuel-A718b]|uniref:hypothetical protein n=1 Tax=Streptomyces sp. Cmuel-A718b TaxID=697328 RepID=UPI00081DF278|nr:hypothetical protein [Streptomyces sp. Cmuel-A718b]SCF63351.1 hypothetical protein GA0115280_104447 [Streptomyces sp. Cmuel-A718b]